MKWLGAEQLSIHCVQSILR